MNFNYYLLYRNPYSAYLTKYAGRYGYNGDAFTVDGVDYTDNNTLRKAMPWVDDRGSYFHYSLDGGKSWLSARGNASTARAIDAANRARFGADYDKYLETLPPEQRPAAAKRLAQQAAAAEQQGQQEQAAGTDRANAIWDAPTNAGYRGVRSAINARQRAAEEVAAAGGTDPSATATPPADPSAATPPADPSAAGTTATPPADPSATTPPAGPAAVTPPADPSAGAATPPPSAKPVATPPPADPSSGAATPPPASKPAVTPPVTKSVAKPAVAPSAAKPVAKPAVAPAAAKPAAKPRLAKSLYGARSGYYGVDKINSLSDEQIADMYTDPHRPRLSAAAERALQARMQQDAFISTYGKFASLNPELIKKLYTYLQIKSGSYRML